MHEFAFRQRLIAMRFLEQGRHGRHEVDFFHVSWIKQLSCLYGPVYKLISLTLNELVLQCGTEDGPDGFF